MLRGKHCRRPITVIGIVDHLGQYWVQSKYCKKYGFSVYPVHIYSVHCAWGYYIIRVLCNEENLGLSQMLNSIRFTEIKPCVMQLKPCTHAFDKKNEPITFSWKIGQKKGLFSGDSVVATLIFNSVGTDRLYCFSFCTHTPGKFLLTFCIFIEVNQILNN